MTEKKTRLGQRDVAGQSDTATNAPAMERRLPAFSADWKPTSGHTLYTVLLCALLVGCTDKATDDATLQRADTLDAQPVGDGTPDQPKGLYVDLDGDGVAELLPDNVEDRRVEYLFGEDEREPPGEGDGPFTGEDTGPDGEHGELDPWDIEYDDELFIEIPAVIKEAGTDSFTCVTGTWKGPDMGIVNSHYVGDQTTNHHLLIFGLPDGWADHVADGELFPCNFDSNDEHVVTPLYTWSTAGMQGIGERLRHGQRYYLELHTLNVFDHPILVNGAGKLLLQSMEKLKGLSAPFMIGPNEILVKPGDYHIQFTYEWPVDASILLHQGHLHEYGKSFAVDWTSSEGTQRILEVEEWEHEYVSINAPGYEYKIDEFKVSVGDIFIV